MPNGGGISATVKHTQSKGQSEKHDTSLCHPPAVYSNSPPPSAVLGIENPPGNFRYPHSHQDIQMFEEHKVIRSMDETDIDYLDTLAKCNLGDYYPVHQPHLRHRAQTLPPIHLGTEIGEGKARRGKKWTRPDR